MQRALALGVAAAVLVLVAPSPVRAAGVTRTAPFDYGISCTEAFASFAAPPLGGSTLNTCSPVPNPVAQATGRLTTREDFVHANAGVIFQGMTRGALVHGDVGPEWSAAGVNVKTTRAGKLTASTLVDDWDWYSVVCIEVGLQGHPPAATKCGGRAPQVTLDVIAATYAVEVVLYPPSKTQFDTNPCPNSGFLTCTLGAAWESGADDVVVKQISYSLS